MSSTAAAAAVPPARSASAAVRHDVDALVEWARALLVAAGLRDDIAADVARVLVDGDRMGHTTHGLAQLPGYLAELERGTMTRAGYPTLVASRAAVQTWDGHRLPGPWLVLRAIDAAIAMARSCGSGTVVIRRSHHIACLAAYLTRATDIGMMVVIQSSDPSAASVAPAGGVSPVFTPDPLAAGIPTGGEPILIDVSASYTTNGLTVRLHQAGERLPHPWVQDANGVPTDDPSVLFGDPKGTLLPLGGIDAGHKGYSLALLIEAMTGGLAGVGRADPSPGWGATVFVQVLDPAAFGGSAAFERQTGWIADACHAATPRPGVGRVRLPGERALAAMRESRSRGVELHPTILPSLAPWAAKLGVAIPTPILT
ncbi:MAG: Ldh family oxidoreductase [Burkholderiales bacterium]